MIDSNSNPFRFSQGGSTRHMTRPITNADIEGTPEHELKVLYEELEVSRAAYEQEQAKCERELTAVEKTLECRANRVLFLLSSIVAMLIGIYGAALFFGCVFLCEYETVIQALSHKTAPYVFGLFLVALLVLALSWRADDKMTQKYKAVILPTGMRYENAIEEDIQNLLKRAPFLEHFNEELKHGRSPLSR